MKNQKYEDIINYHCPRCKDFKVWELGNYIYCPQCTLTFNKDQLNEFNDSEILSREELEKIIKVMNDKMNL